MTDQPGRTCGKCGATTTTTEDQCPVATCRAVLPRNGLAVTHGMDRALEEQPAALAAIDERAAQILSDHGGDGSYVKASQIRDYCRLELMVESGFAHLAGLANDDDASLPFTGKGKTRALADKLVQHMLAKHRIGMALGLERRQRPIRTALEYVEGAS